MKDHEKEIELLKEKVKKLEKLLDASSKKSALFETPLKTVSVPPPLEELFNIAEQKVGDYFRKIEMDPSKASIKINDERYVLLKASSLSIGFLSKIQDLYADRGEKEAFKIGQTFLFDIAHVIGLEDAKEFHKKLNLKTPDEKLSAGPVHFAYSGWAYVDILEGDTVANEDFYIKYNHPYSFEADSWINEGKVSEVPVCIMNAGYSSGWCEASYGVSLTAVELTCRAKGDEHCTFVMAHPSRIGEYIHQDADKKLKDSEIDIPSFFERKRAEAEILKSLKEKSLLLKEVHHRVKNNLQIISSLLNLQSNYFEDPKAKAMFDETRNRIKAIALVHQRLYQSDNASYANFKEYIISIAQLLADSSGIVVNYTFDTVGVKVEKMSIEKAISFGLIFNEVVTNSIKHAFPEGSKEPIELKVMLASDDTMVQMIVEDNGIGLLGKSPLESSSTLGIQLIVSLAEQLEGTVEYSSLEGAKFELYCKK